MVDVFISYKREERARCERIANKLKALNLDVWFNARLPSGKCFDREIESAIKKAKAAGKAPGATDLQSGPCAIRDLVKGRGLNGRWIRNWRGER
jgi:pantoate kinase